MDVISPSASVLKRFYRDPARNLKLILSHELDRLKPPGSDVRQAVTRTVYGVIRHRELLNLAIRTYSTRPLDRIRQDILPLLQIGVYLLLYSQSYPDYAVVNEIGNAAGVHARGFVNAILRRVAVDKRALLASFPQTPDLSTRYSIADILIDRLRLISDDIQADLEYLNREPRFHLRVNTAKITVEEGKRMLNDHHVSFRELEQFPSFEIKESARVIRELLDRKLFYFQGTASQMVSFIASRYAQGKVLDCCAAPGTKSVTLALLHPGLTIFAGDIHLQRETFIRDVIAQYGIPNIFPFVSDARFIAIKPRVDLVIADLPCTSSGTLRKNPDLKLKIDRESIAANANLQHAILSSIMTLSPRHILYAVCSFIQEETEAIVEKLAASFEFQTMDLAPLLDTFGFRYQPGRYGYYLLPDDTLNNDLFYISLIRKN
ncbi:MAG: RsmB/NOP family class I SAM-dependent RNA methyltransferase [Candidatus Omnitrophota bacterium]